MDWVNVEHFFGKVRPEIWGVRNLTPQIVEQIRNSLEAGVSENVLEIYLRLSQGTISRWIREGRLGQDMLYTQERLLVNIKNCKDLDRRLALLELVKDVNLVIASRTPLVHMGFVEPEWHQALLDRKADVNLKHISAPAFWYIAKPEILQMHINAGANVNWTWIDREGKQTSVLEHHAMMNASPRKLECLNILIQAGASLDSLFRILYDTVTITEIDIIARALLNAGYGIDLKCTVFRRALQGQLSRVELIRCIPPKLKHAYYGVTYSYERLLAKLLPLLKRYDVIIEREIKRAVERAKRIRDVILDSLTLSADVCLIISQYVNEYTPR